MVPVAPGRIVLPSIGFRGSSWMVKLRKNGWCLIGKFLQYIPLLSPYNSPSIYFIPYISQDNKKLTSSKCNTALHPPLPPPSIPLTLQFQFSSSTHSIKWKHLLPLLGFVYFLGDFLQCFDHPAQNFHSNREHRCRDCFWLHFWWGVLLWHSSPLLHALHRPGHRDSSDGSLYGEFAFGIIKVSEHTTPSTRWLAHWPINSLAHWLTDTLTWLTHSLNT